MNDSAVRVGFVGCGKQASGATGILILTGNTLIYRVRESGREARICRRLADFRHHLLFYWRTSWIRGKGF